MKRRNGSYEGGTQSTGWVLVVESAGNVTLGEAKSARLASLERSFSGRSAPKRGLFEDSMAMIVLLMKGVAVDKGGCY